MSKEKIIGFRIDDLSKNRLDALSAFLGEKKRKIIRIALNYHFNRETRSGPLTLLGTNEYDENLYGCRSCYI